MSYGLTKVLLTPPLLPLSLLARACLQAQAQADIYKAMAYQGSDTSLDTVEDKVVHVTWTKRIFRRVRRAINYVPSFSTPDEKGDLLVKVEYCGVSFQDVLLKHGFAHVKNERFDEKSYIMGTECAGLVLSENQPLEEQKSLVGKRVLALPENGAWRKYLRIDRNKVIPLPEDMSTLEAVSLGTHHLFAMKLVNISKVDRFNTVLIFSAGGPMGIALAQICRSITGVKIIGIASHTKFEDLTENQKPPGAKARRYYDFLYDYTDDFVTKIRGEEGKTNRRPIDVLFDGVGGPYSRDACNLIKKGGRYVCYGTTGGFNVNLDVRRPSYRVDYDLKDLWWKNCHIFHKHLRRGVIFVGRSLRYDLHEVYKDIQEYEIYFHNLLNLWRKKQVGPFLHCIYPLAQANDALLTIERRWNVGKILLTLDFEEPVIPLPPKEPKMEEIYRKFLAHATRRFTWFVNTSERPLRPIGPSTEYPRALLFDQPRLSIPMLDNQLLPLTAEGRFAEARYAANRPRVFPLPEVVERASQTDPQNPPSPSITWPPGDVNWGREVYAIMCRSFHDRDPYTDSSTSLRSDAGSETSERSYSTVYSDPPMRTLTPLDQVGLPTKPRLVLHPQGKKIERHHSEGANVSAGPSKLKDSTPYSRSMTDPVLLQSIPEKKVLFHSSVSSPLVEHEAEVEKFTAPERHTKSLEMLPTARRHMIKRRESVLSLPVKVEDRAPESRPMFDKEVVVIGMADEDVDEDFEDIPLVENLVGVYADFMDGVVYERNAQLVVSRGLMECEFFGPSPLTYNGRIVYGYEPIPLQQIKNLLEKDVGNDQVALYINLCESLEADIAQWREGDNRIGSLLADLKARCLPVSVRTQIPPALLYQPKSPKRFQYRSQPSLHAERFSEQEPQPSTSGVVTQSLTDLAEVAAMLIDTKDYEDGDEEKDKKKE